MKNIIVYLNILIILTSCGADNEREILSSENKIESFIIEGIETNISQTDKTIDIITTASQTDFLFTPEIIVSDKASVSPASETSLDFSNEINFTVTAEDGTNQIYKSSLVHKAGLQNVILKLESDFQFQTFYYNGVINEVDKKIIIDFPKSDIQTYQYKTYLTINIAGDNASSIPESDTEIDIESLNAIQISQSEGNETYSIEFRNTENSLTCFSLPVTKHFPCALPANSAYEEYSVGLQGNDLIFYTIEGQNVTSIAPDILNIPSGAVVTPSSETNQDFTNDIVYEVISEAEILNKQTVRVIKKKILLTNDWDPSLFNGQRVSNTSFFLRYYAVSKIMEATLINLENSNEIPCEVIGNDYIDSTTETYLVLKYSTQPSVGQKFYLRVILEDGNVIDTKYKISISPD